MDVIVPDDGVSHRVHPPALIQILFA